MTYASYVTWFLFVAMFVALAWRWLEPLIEKAYRDKPNRAWVMVEVGDGYEPVMGRLDITTEKGLLLEYKWKGKLCHAVVPKDYRVSFYRHRRLVYVRQGEIVALPPGGWTSNVNIDTEAVNELIEGRIVVQALQSLRSNKTLDIIKIALIGLGLALVLFGFMAWRNGWFGSEVGPGSASIPGPAVTTPAPSGGTVEKGVTVQ